MDTAQLDLEDGEVVDEEPDAFDTYKILQRPHIPTNHRKIITNYSDDTEESSESASDSDSQSGIKKMKRPKLRAKRRKIESDSTNKIDKYKIWNTQVQEEALTADLISCGVTKKLYQGRNVENYDLPIHYHLNGHKTLGNRSSDDDKEDEKDVNIRTSNKRTHADRSNVKLRLGKKSSSMDVDSQKGCVRTISDLSITIESSDSQVACDITEKLHEKKDSLIQRIVRIVGKQKAIEFYQKTKEIEENGGLLIMNGSRRRTPGGVYLYLVKNDDYIPQEKIREIFAVDKKENAEQKKKAGAAKIREKANQLMKNLENGSENDLPTLLTRAELSTQQIAEEARLRRGEGMNRTPVDSDRTVSNPPPSPVTDDPDHSEHVTVQRQLQDYSEDFLDIGVDIDSMETF
ncbi:phosphorylated adapter RNA export protein [Chelonus insularis]|uniref:phosphorylated adapter RNA export protein n=1 Tax=Chelonus insularis TaxID=460826 RepID=UPI00158B03E3|nr:phosphorylated adapter RNA export protein [Chelonus insularis]